jgi:hypothetical protein
MTYDEALHLLGLDESATETDIKLAYKEMAQILHPDKFAGNKRLSERANEQFKMVNEARDLLLGKRAASRGGRKQAGARSSGSGGSGSSGSDSYGSDRVTSLKARLAGIAAARTQLTAQLDVELDRRRIATYLIIGGIIGMILGEVFKMRMIEPLGGTALIWGVIQFFSSQSNVKTIQEHLADLEKDRKKCEKELDKF